MFSTRTTTRTTAVEATITTNLDPDLYIIKRSNSILKYK